MDGTTVLPTEQTSTVRSITAPDFWAAFKAAAFSQQISGGRPPRGSARTKLAIDANINSLHGRHGPGLLASLAQTLGLEYRREFYGFDVVFYQGEVQRRRWRAPARILVVLEHENDAFAAHEELYKLSWIAAPLKVLITYPPGRIDERQMLDSYSRLLQELDVQEMGQLMLIFGLPGRYPAWADWKAYLYSDKLASFEKLGDLTR